MKILKTSFMLSATILLIATSNSVSAEGKLSKISKEVTAQEQKVTNLKKNLESAKSDQQMKQSSKDQTSADLSNASEELKTLEDKKDESMKKLKSSTHHLKEKSESVKIKQKQIKDREHELESSMNLTKLSEGLDGIAEIFEGKDSKLDELRKDLSKLGKEEFDLMTLQSKARDKFDSSKKELDALQSKIKYVSLDKSAKEEELAKSVNAVKSLEVELDKENKVLEAKKSQKKDVESNLAKYAIGDAESDFLGEEDQALFEQVKSQIDSGDVGLTDHTRQMRHFIIAKFNVKVAGGFRQDEDGTGHGHGSGMAVDFMADKETGDKIAKYLQRNFTHLGIYYMIWEQRYFMNIPNIYGPANRWNLMDDRGSITQNHYDHVHVSFAK